MLSKRVHVV